MLTKHLAVRVSTDFFDRFRVKAEQYGQAGDVHREILEAFVEDRLNIQPNPNKPSMEKLYVIRSDT